MKVPDFHSLRSVLIVKPSSLGDVVHTLPAVHRLKLAFPHLRIDWLVNPEWKPLLEGNPDLVELIDFPRRDFKGKGGWKRYRAWMQAFKGRPQADVALDFQGLFRSAWVARQSGARVVLGLSDSREGARLFHHGRVKVDSSVHAVDRYLELSSACGATGGPVLFPMPPGSCPQGIFKDTVSKDFVILHPFSRGENKSLTGLQVKLFCEMMAPRGVYVVGNAVVPEQLLRLPSNAFNVLNETSLPELIWLMRHARFSVSVDSGPMHIAAAISSKVLGIHTWSDPRLVGPYPQDAWVWKGGKILPRIQADAALANERRQVHDDDIEPMVSFLLGVLAVG